MYTNEHKGEFPDDLGQLVSDLALQFGFSMKAEAAIVNFYPNPKCYMGGHLGTNRFVLVGFFFFLLLFSLICVL